MAFDPNKITFFARADARGQNVNFGIKAKDRQRHVYVIGKTGMGKSTLLENMAVQDIQNGEGMAFIDPHGSAAETLLNYIPEHRIKDVLYFSPADTDFPVSFNIMEDVGPDKRHLVVSGLMSVFKKIWVDAWSARMEYILQNTLLALLEYPGSTLIGVNRMLSDKDYRKMVIDNISDPSVKSFWVDEFLKYNERYMQEAGDAIKNKIGQFTANPIIRNIIGQPKSSFDIREMMDQKKIIIMNLSKGLIGETNANLLGSMLTTRIYLAAMSRADFSPERMREAPNFYFYVDEFQSFANATFANILSEARKYHLNLTIAHQYIEQMEEEVRNAVFGNVGTIISFRVGPFDAEVLETIFTPQFLATDIVNLSFAQIYLTLMIDGIGSQPFSATTLPPIDTPSVSCKDMVIASSRQQFSRTRVEVEELIHKFHEPVVLPKVVRAPKATESDGSPRPVKIEEGIQTEPRTEPRRESASGRSGGDGAPRTERRDGVRSERSSDRSRGERPPLRPREERSEVRREVPRTQPRDTEVIQTDKSVSESKPADAVPPKKTEAVPVQKESQNLDDLKSVLRRIVKEEVKETPRVHGAKQSPEQKTALKEILQTMHEAAPVTQPLNNPQPEPVPQQADVVPLEKPVVPPQVVQNAPTEERPVSTPRVTPKELERMMRVTTNDKPPL